MKNLQGFLLVMLFFFISIPDMKAQTDYSLEHTGVKLDSIHNYIDSLMNAGIQGGDGLTYIYKTSTESRTSSTTLADDAVLKFNTEANSIYIIKLGANGSFGPGAGIKFKFNHTGTTTSFICFKYNLMLQTISNTFSYLDNLATEISADAGAGTSYYRFETNAIRLTVGGSGGVFSLQWAQKNNDADPANVFNTSWIAYKTE